MENNNFDLSAALGAARTAAAERKEWWKIPVGAFSVSVVKSPNRFIGKDFGGNPQERIAMEVRVIDLATNKAVSEKPLIMGVNVDSRPDSLYFQLLLAAQENGGSFANLSFQLIVKAKGKGKDYTIPSVAHLVSQEQARAKAPVPSVTMEELA